MSDNSKGGITAVSLLQICFIVLKLTNLITWSWFWVLAPLWIELLFVLILVVLFLRW